MSGQFSEGVLPRRAPTAVQVVLVTVLSLPAITWISTTGDLANYWRYDVPAGQVMYVLSKLTALYAIVIFWLQLMYGLLGSVGRQRLGIERGHLFHVRLGLAVIVLIVAHVCLFVLGATLRARVFASQYLTPSFSSGYYRTVITIGLAALVLVAIGAVCAAARRRIRRIWRVGHWAVFVAFGLGFIHSLLIGSESRITPMLAFYAVSGAATTAALARRLTLR
jgi:predicted ferric reductase